MNEKTPETHKTPDTPKTTEDSIAKQAALVTNLNKQIHQLNAQITEKVKENGELKERVKLCEETLNAAESRFGARGWAVSDNRIAHENLKKLYTEKYLHEKK